MERSSPVVAVERKISCTTHHKEQRCDFCYSDNARERDHIDSKYEKEGSEWIEVETSSLDSSNGSVKMIYRASAVIMAVPINLLGNIGFSPALDPALATVTVTTPPTQLHSQPTTLQQPSCALYTNAGTCAKVWLRAFRLDHKKGASSHSPSENMPDADSNETPSFNHVMGLPSSCAESYTMPWVQLRKDMENQQQHNKQQPHQRQEEKEPCPDASKECITTKDVPEEGELFAILRCADRLPSRPEAELLFRTHHPGATVSQEPFGHDWLADPWSRGSWMVLQSSIIYI